MTDNMMPYTIKQIQALEEVQILEEVDDFLAFSAWQNMSPSQKEAFRNSILRDAL